MTVISPYVFVIQLMSVKSIVTALFVMWFVEGRSQFVSVGTSLGVVQITTGSSEMGHAVSIHDFNGDGLDDISFGTTSQAPRFYRNTGTGFVLESFNLISPDNSIKSILWVDIDNDGDKDLFISYENSSIRLYENLGNLNLVDITIQSGLELEFGIRHWGACFGDYNNDGYLDLYLCKYYNSQIFSGEQYENKLYRNNGNNTFTNVTYEANASVGVNASFMATWFDYNGDGWQDLFIVNDRIFNPNHLLRNNGDGTFTNVAVEAGVHEFMDSMSCSLGDYNNDLLQDFFVANSQTLGNHLYRKNGNNTFQNVANQAGVLGMDLCWSGLWMDYDNNGWLDLHVAVEQHNLNQAPRNFFYRNNADGTFTEIGNSVGLGADQVSTWATAQGDWNMDGYPDFVSHNRAPFPSYLWQNAGGSNHYLAVRLEGVVSNRDAIGSTIYCYANGSGQMRYMACGENYLSQDSQRKLFGLGQTEMVDSVVVKWLSGHVDRLYNIPVNQTLYIVEGSTLQVDVEVSGSLSLCPGDSVTLDAGSGWDGYLWSTGDTTQTIVVEQGGLYSVLVTSGAFSAESEQLEVIELPGPQISHSVGNVLCNGGNSGTIEIFNMGGTGLSSVIWLPEGEGEWLTELAAGTYSYHYTDANGCVATGEVEVTEPPLLVISELVSHVLCFGDDNGSIELTNEIGTGVGSVVWNPILDGDAIVTGVPAGVYQYQFTDGNGCTTEGQVTVEGPSLPGEIFVVLQDPNETDCPDLWSGDVLVLGATPPFVFQYTFFEGGNLVNQFESEEAGWNCIGGQADGIVQIQIVDANGCQSTVIHILDAIIQVVEFDSKHGIVVYPNPIVRGQQLVISGARDFVGLYDSMGRLVDADVQSEAPNALSLGLEGAAPGIYFLRLADAAGKARVFRILMLP